MTAGDSWFGGSIQCSSPDSEPLEVRHARCVSFAALEFPSGGPAGTLSSIDGPRDVRRVLHPVREVLLLVVCGTIADCDDYDAIADWGEAHLGFLRQHLPYSHVPGGRWLTILMNRINPTLFSATFTAWVRETWPDRPPFRHRWHDPASQPRPGYRRRLSSWSPPSPPLAALCSARGGAGQVE